MIRINVVAVGKLKDKFYREAADEYLKRLKRFASVTETECTEYPDSPNSLAADRESKEIMTKLKGHVVLLDVGGEEMSSERFSEYLERLAASGKSEVTFVIGGSRGVSADVKKAADIRLGFGKMTFPHALARVMLLEQIYRAFAIMSGSPYHK